MKKYKGRNVDESFPNIAISFCQILMNDFSFLLMLNVYCFKKHSCNQEDTEY